MEHSASSSDRSRTISERGRTISERARSLSQRTRQISQFGNRLYTPRHGHSVEVEPVADETPYSEQPEPAALSKLAIASYSVGHVLNDMSAACWFTYLLVLLTEGYEIQPYMAGFVILAGQVADAIATPIVGLMSDASKGCNRCGLSLGRRKLWYTAGFVTVALGFFLVFGFCICDIFPNPSHAAVTVFMCIAASLFNVGWAMVQVSHGVFVLDMSSDEHERVVLNSARYAMTIVANMLVFGLFWLLMHEFSMEGVQEEFRWMAYCTLAIGTICSFAFLFGTTEPRHDAEAHQKKLDTIQEEAPVAGQDHLHYTWRDWLKLRVFYEVVFLPFYLLNTIKLPRTTIAIIPLVIYVAGLITAIFMKPLNQRLGRKKTFAIGAFISLCTFVGFRCLQPPVAVWVYLSAVLLGVGTSTIMSGAFVYGALSFADKLANGIAIFVLQAVLYIPAAFTVLALVVMLELKLPNGTGMAAVSTEEDDVPKLEKPSTRLLSARDADSSEASAQ